MAKIKYITRHTDVTVLSKKIFPFLTEYFDFEIYDPTTTYDRSGTLFMASIRNEPQWAQDRLDQGYRVVIVNLSEMPVTMDQYVLQHKNFFWYQEHFLIKQFGGDQYRPQRTYNKLAFMPMRLTRPFRARVVQALRPYLDQFIWSYDSSLPQDRFDHNGRTVDRHFCPEWYDQTCFSIVVETDVEKQNFITEKTFKPIAFQHPFMVIAQQNTLSMLHALGFVTYENEFDESYDDESNFIKRLAAIQNNIVNATIKPYSTITLEKIQHNYNHFFNEPVVIDRMMSEIINPLLEYAAT